MGTVGLGHLPRDRPNSGLKIYVLPLHGGHLAAPLCRYQQHFENRSKGPAELVKALPKIFHLVIGEHAIALRLSAGCTYHCRRGRRHHVAFHRPIEKLSNCGQDPIGHVRPSLLKNRLDDLDHISPRDVLERPSSPLWQNIDFEDAFRLLGAAVPAGVFVDEELNTPLEEIGTGSSLSCTLHRRVVPPRRGLHGFPRRHSRICKSKCRIGPDCHSAKPAAVPVEYDPGPRALIGNPKRKPGQSQIEVLDASALGSL